MEDLWTLAFVKKFGSGGSDSADYVRREKVGDYLYEVWYDGLDYAWAEKYFNEHEVPMNGACSAVRNGNLYGRNFDWLYSNNVEFIVHTPKSAGRFETLGIVGSIGELTKEFVESGEKSDAYRLVPFMLVDGINEHGVIANSNVVPTDGGANDGIPDSTVEKEINAMMLVRYILDNFDSAQSAVEYIKAHVHITKYDTLNGMSYELHWMVADKDKTYLIELADNSIVVIDMTSGSNSTLAGKPYMTNFRLYGVTLNSDGTVYTPYTQDATHNAMDTNGITEHGSGLERYNIIAENYGNAATLRGMRDLMETQLKYTNAYSIQVENQAWFTEFVGVNDLTCASPYTEFADVMVTARQMYTDRDRNDPDTWQTVHTAVYDITEKKLYLKAQEGAVRYERGIENKEVSVDGVVRYDEAQSLTDAQKARARSNIGAEALPEVTSEDNGKVLGVAEGGFWWFSPEDMNIATTAYVNDAIAAAIGDAIGGEY